MKKIDFIGIGAQKAGTTWLYLRLKELPDFSFPYVRDIHYFDKSTEYFSAKTLSEEKVFKRLKNVQWLRNSLTKVFKNLLIGNINKAKWLMKWYYMNYTDKWYLSLFSGIDKLTGEFTPSYSFLKVKDIRRIYNIVPNTKIILILRNPIERAWSQFRFKFKSKKNEFHYKPKLKKRYNHSNSLEEIIKFIDSEKQEIRSNYIKTLKNYASIFPKSQILIGFYDAIIDTPDQLLSEVIDFIGGEASYIPLYCKLHQKNNVSPSIDMPDKIYEYLKNKYYLDIKELSDLFGGYCNKWLFDVYQEKSKNKENELRPTINIGHWMDKIEVNTYMLNENISS